MEDLKPRTKRFALEIILFVENLPHNETCRVLGKQLLRSGTSVGANYRAARRARSSSAFIYKMGIVEEEADESAFWIELLVESGHVRPEASSSLMGEASELTAIAVGTLYSY
jgi:four helix bundle protein